MITTIENAQPVARRISTTAFKQAAKRFADKVHQPGKAAKSTNGTEGIPGVASAAATRLASADRHLRASAGQTASSRRKEHLSQMASSERARAMVKEADSTGVSFTQNDTLRSLGFERIIGSDDMVDMNYLELAIAVGRAVARVKVGNGAGTGTLVGPRILMTNHHVIPSRSDAQQAIAQFDYQENASGDLLPVHNYSFDPELFFVTDEILDFTLIGVAPLSHLGRSIEDYPWLPLIAQLGKAEKGDPVNIIQHPRGGLKHIALRNNLIIEIPQGAPSFLYYTTDTEPGSSGSSCFNDQWEIVALHHSGVPRMENGQILRRDGKPFNEKEDDPLLIEWIANEGARTSAVVAALKQVSLSGQQSDLRARMLEREAPNPVELARRPQTDEKSYPVNGQGRQTPSPQSVSISVPLQITLTLGQPAGAAAPAIPMVLPTATEVRPAPKATSSVAEEAVVIDPDWVKRAGYDSEFLGIKVPLPKLSQDMQKITAEVPPEYRVHGDKHVFAYHHYSLAMNKRRRFAWYSAAVIDGEKTQKLPKRKGDKWFLDPRMDPDASAPSIECGEELYATANTDRGHLTRYLDLAWGDTKAEALAATNDTFHFSNCSLQLSGFNKGKDRWQGLEIFLLENKARKEQRKMIVFTGPVFKTNDPRYQNEYMDYTVRIPVNFWKVCALVRADGSLSASAFVLDQDDIQTLPGFEEKFDAGPCQITIRELEKKTHLDFGTLSAHDHLAQGGDPGTLEIERDGAKNRIKVIESFEDIVI